MIANGDEIESILKKEYLINADFDKINAGSIDLHVNEDFWTLKGGETIDLSKKEKPSITKVEKDGEGLIEFKPGMCLLASTKEEFNLPSHFCSDIRLRSSIARCFINHMFASWADAGFHGSNLTLEFVNHSTNTYLIKEELSMVQLIFYHMQPVSNTYNYKTKGRYNKEKGTIGSKSI